MPDSGVARLTELVFRARAGSREALGELLDVCRPYLLAVANEELESGLRPKGGASDLVQETFLEAQEGIEQFRGGTEAELLAWLRRILLNNLSNFRRHYQATDKRLLARELAIDHSSKREIKQSLTADTKSPSECAEHRDQLDRLRQALDSLPSSLREVIVWRNLELLPFAEIARRLNGTEKAAQKFWSRAIRALHKKMSKQI